MVIPVQGASGRFYHFTVLNNYFIPEEITNCVYIYGNLKAIYPDIQYVGITTRPLVDRHKEHGGGNGTNNGDGKFQCAIENGANSIWIYT